MNQLMTPGNLNSIAGAVDSMLNQGSNQSENSKNISGNFRNIFSNLMGS